MRKQVGLTMIDVAVALACVALVLAQAGVINAGGRERSKREVCLANLRTLTASWKMYADDNAGKLVNGGQTGMGFGGAAYDWVKEPWWCTPLYPLPTSDEFGTFNAKRFDWDLTLPYGERVKLLQQGALYKYCPDVTFFRCPEADKNMHRSYIMPSSMNAEWQNAPPGYISQGGLVKNTGQIARPSERIVFLEEKVITPDAFQFPTPSGLPWTFDKPNIMHSDGVNFGFADGHADYRKWECAAVLRWAKSDTGGTPTMAELAACPTDYNWLLNAVWGITQ